MELNVNDSNLFWIIYILGLATALEFDALQPEECEVLLFNPYVEQKFKEMKISKKVVEMVCEGMELDDIKRLIPEHFNKSVRNIRDSCISYLQSCKTIEYPINRYFG